MVRPKGPEREREIVKLSQEALPLLTASRARNWPDITGVKAKSDVGHMGQQLVRVYLIIPEEAECTIEAADVLLSISENMRRLLATAGIGAGKRINARLSVHFLESESEFLAHT
ncbi:MAG: hypothetical protein Q8S73_33120 [Deltaproteobacteria bacterium]|nr:hypothetical protein [Myxococcales bacterium]MDP3218988.1 hypothetical protein [Deltaproteobacteria bacterium]